MASYENIDYGSPDGCLIGVDATKKVGFYGTTPVVQRATAAAQSTSNVGTASSSDVTTGLKAAVIEIMNTLIAIGIWAG